MPQRYGKKVGELAEKHGNAIEATSLYVISSNYLPRKRAYNSSFLLADSDNDNVDSVYIQI